MFYDRKIKYLDYMENGDKVRSAGFVKMEVVGENCNIQVSVNGLYRTDTLQREVWIGDGGKETVLGEIELEAGKGSLSMKKVPAAGLGMDPIPYGDLFEIRIKLAKNRELRCQWGENASAGVPQSALREEKEAVWDDIVNEKDSDDQGLLYVKWMQKVDSKLPEEVRTASDHPEPASMELKNPPAVLAAADEENYRYMSPESERAVLEEPADLKMVYSEPQITESAYPERVTPGEIAREPQGCQLTDVGPEEWKETEKSSEITIGQEAAEERAAAVTEQEAGNHLSEESHWVEPRQPEVPVTQKNPSVPPNLFEDKWKQLSCIYPHISPFHDGRDYLSIGPADFVVLSRKYHKLVTNSFLLHGFYNYEHLILTRVMKKGEEIYYLGVPGNFYDREKQVAVMFGFESFECKTEPAQTGDYGYFMMRVDI